MPKTITPRASRAAVTDVYEDLEALIHFLSRRFANFYNMDFDEVLSRANMIFLEAYHTFEPGGGREIHKRVQYLVWNRLMDWQRSEAKRAARIRNATDLNWELDDGAARNRDINHDRSNLDTENFVRKKSDTSSRDTGKLIARRSAAKDGSEFDRNGFEDALDDERSVEALAVILDQTDLWYQPGTAPQTALRRYLRGLGWAAGQITDALSEIKRALL